MSEVIRWVQGKAKSAQDAISVLMIEIERFD